MHAAMKNSELIDKLVFIAGGDVCLVSRAIKATATWRAATWLRKAACDADLKAVVDYIVQRRER